MMIDLHHRTQRIMAVLFHAASDGQYVIELHAGFPSPEREHGLEIVGVESDIHARLGQVHFTPSFSSVWRSKNSFASSTSTSLPRLISRNRVAAVRVK